MQETDAWPTHSIVTHRMPATCPSVPLRQPVISLCLSFLLKLRGEETHLIQQDYLANAAYVNCSVNSENLYSCSVIHLCLSLCNSVDYGLPGSSVPGISQRRILE